MPERLILLRRLEAALATTSGLRRAHVLVAVSGGPDSTALLAGLAELASGYELRLTAGHVDHGLRGAEGAGERDLVATRAAACGAGFMYRAVALDPGPNLEERARRARYRALVAMAEEADAGWIATAHTRDDQVETILLRLLRGAGRRGLGGMRPVRGRLLRPLLDATRTDVRRYLAARGLPFAVDRTNADLARTRNRVRRLLVPFLEAEFNPRLGAALGALANRLRDEDDYLAALAATRAAVHVDGDALRVGVAEEPTAIARRVVRAWLVAAGGASAAHVERVLALARRGRGAVAVPGPARVLREGDRLVRRPGRAPVAVPFELPIRPGEAVVHPGGAWRLVLSPPRPRPAGSRRPSSAASAWFDADGLPGGLHVRGPRRGDRVRLLAGGTRKLQDVLVDAKVPRESRPEAAVLAAGPDIIWVAGVARGAAAPVTEATRQIVEAVLERNFRKQDCGH